MTDLLSMERINALPQPLFSRDLGDKDWWWPVYDICVETGLYRIDVCGKLQAKHISDCGAFRDADGVEHDPESFYVDWEPADGTGRAPSPPQTAEAVPGMNNPRPTPSGHTPDCDWHCDQNPQDCTCRPPHKGGE